MADEHRAAQGTILSRLKERRHGACRVCHHAVMKLANLSCSAVLLMSACSPRANLPPVMPPPPLPALTVPDVVRDERLARRPSRTKEMLVTELQDLEPQLSTSPDQPKLLRGLAEDYAELASLAVRERAPDKSIRDARSAAMKYYDVLVNEYPQWCAVPDAADPTKGKGCVDDALYSFALEAEHVDQLDRARFTYLKLIKTWPESRFVPSAYFAFGELFMLEVNQDLSNLRFAEKSFQKVIQLAPPNSRLSGYALYRLAQAHMKRGDEARTLSFLLKAAIFAKGNREDPDLGATARRAAVIVYARVGIPTKAREFFSKMASSPEELEEMLTDLQQHLDAQ